MGQRKHEHIPLTEHFPCSVAAVDCALHHGAVRQQSALALAGGAAGEYHNARGLCVAFDRLRRAAAALLDRNERKVGQLGGCDRGVPGELIGIDQRLSAELQAAAQKRHRVQMRGHHYGGLAERGNGEQRLDRVVAVCRVNRYPLALPCPFEQQGAETGDVLLELSVGMALACVDDRRAVCVVAHTARPHLGNCVHLHDPLELLGRGKRTE